MHNNLITTAVGSYPKPPHLMEARAKAARAQISRDELMDLEKKATEHWIRLQEDLDMDILVDGEMYRGDMATYFAENLEGMDISGLVRSYGNRYYRKPVATGAIKRPKAITVDWWKYSQSLTDRPVKGMLTGPYTIADWSFDEHFGSREAFVLNLARVINEEARDLQAAGCRYIQIDEPAASTRPEEMALVAEGLRVSTEGLDAVTITHICYGDFATVFDGILTLPVDVLDLEMANSDYHLLEYFEDKKTDKILALGVFDVHHHAPESIEAMEAGIERALNVLPGKQIWVTPDCGLKTRTEEESMAKLKNMMQATNNVRARRGLS